MMANLTPEDRLRRLEELVTHQDQLLQDLNSVVLQLRQQWEVKLTELGERLERLESVVDESTTQDPDERPPHY